MAAKYYRRIRMDRLAMLLGLSEGEAEKELSALVSDGDLFAKIDRPAGIVSFTPRVSPEETLSAWSSSPRGALGTLPRCSQYTADFGEVRITPGHRAEPLCTTA